MAITPTSDITSGTIDLIKHGLSHARTVNADQELYNQIKNYYMKGIEKAVEKAMHEGKYEVEIPISMNQYYEHIKNLMQNPLEDIITELADLGYTVQFRFPSQNELSKSFLHKLLVLRRL